MNAPRVGMVWYGMVCNNEVSKYTYITNCKLWSQRLLGPSPVQLQYNTRPAHGGGCILPIVVKIKK